MEDHLSESMRSKAREDLAWTHFFAGRRKSALEMACVLIEEHESGGHMLAGMVHEYGGDGIPIDFETAIAHYRSWACVDRFEAPYRYLARAHLKRLGEGDLKRAGDYLMEARQHEHTGALYLALGTYHGLQEEWGLSVKYNLIALFHGRILGMRRASAALSQGGYVPLGWLLRALQILVGPVMWLFLGKKILEDF